MAPKVILNQLSCITFLILTAISLSVHASSSSNFTLIKHFQGYKKGENAKDLHILKSYLQNFGYLNYQNHPNQSMHATADYFDDELEAAVKMYQVNYRLKPTGVLDDDTVSLMAMPRCGVPDISNGVNLILSNSNRRRSRDHGNRKDLHMVSHFAFFAGKDKWNKKQLSYAYYAKVNPTFEKAIAGAFNKWASASQYFTFKPARDAKTSDLKIGFYRGDHKDGYPFDGPFGILAHANPPPGGILHMDADEKWVVGDASSEYTVDLGSVALHEIGHLLGLDHSNVKAAAMYAIAPVSGVKGLHADDIKGIKTLYNVRT